MSLTLRPYQQTAIANVLADWRDFNRVLITMATGTGKTVVFLEVLDRVLREDAKARALILVHRKHLVDQPLERLQTFWPSRSLQTGLIQGDRHQPGGRIVIGTVQSLVNETRLQDLLRHGPITHVVIDEAHRGIAETYNQVLTGLGKVKLLGCTATPKRTDKIALAQLFEKVSYKIDILTAIREGALVPFNPWRVTLPNVDFSQVRQTEDGWDEEEAGKLLSAENVLEIIFAKWREIAGHRQTIGFCASVGMAEACAAYFSNAGVPSGAISYKTKKQERTRLQAQYENGELQCLFNMDVFTEGYDAPATGCVIMARPTRSDLIYVQAMGRGLRLHPASGKLDCTIIDFAPVGARDIIMAGDVLEGMPPEVKKAYEKAEEQGLELFGMEINADGGIGIIDPEDVKVEMMNLLAHHRLAWNFDGQIATCALSKTNTLAIVVPDRDRLEKADDLRRAGQWTSGRAQLAGWLEKYRLYLLGKNETNTWHTELLATTATMGEAKDLAESMSTYEDATISRKKSFWREKPMSDAQARFLRQLGAFQPGLTSGQAASRITHVLATREVQAYENRQQKSLVNGRPAQASVLQGQYANA